MSIIHFINFPLRYNTFLPSSMNYRVKTQQFKYIYILYFDEIGGITV